MSYKVTVGNDMSHIYGKDYFPRLFHYEKEAIKLAKIVANQGGENVRVIDGNDNVVFIEDKPVHCIIEIDSKDVFFSYDTTKILNIIYVWKEKWIRAHSRALRNRPSGLSTEEMIEIAQSIPGE